MWDRLVKVAFSDGVYLLSAFSLILVQLFVLKELWAFDRKTKAFLSDGDELSGKLPKVSVIVPAKDEEAGIRECLNSLSKQTYKNLECILIDDRSEDFTGAVMEEFSKKHSHFKMISIKELPKGWLGKNHALQTGADRAEGEYLLFTDGDVIFEKEAISRAVHTAVTKGLDHLCIAPKLKAPGLWLSACNIFIEVSLLTVLRPSKIRKGGRFYAGMGAFNLVRQKSYQTAGEHKKFKNEALDDLILGKLMVFSGFSSAMIYGKNIISLTWYKNIKEMIRGLEKNGFAAWEYSVFRLSLAGAAMLYFYFLPFVFVFSSDGLARAGFIVFLLLQQAVFFSLGGRLAYRSLSCLLVPLAGGVVYFAHLRSAFMGLTRGEVLWRGAAHSLKELKESRRKLSKEMKSAAQKTAIKQSGF